MSVPLSERNGWKSNRQITSNVVLPHAYQAKISCHPQNENFVHVARIYCLGINRSLSLMAIWCYP
ncbi:hypothetical protein FT638_28975 [Bacillus cereus]|nr:hypothetical protein [Bacillus cereus]